MGEKRNWRQVMMRGIYILCEGPSEEEFVNNIMRSHFQRFEIYDVRPILMSTSKGHKGGDIKYDRLKYNIDRLLRRENDIIVTTFIDFFRLRTDFPMYSEAQLQNDKVRRVELLEQALLEAIDSSRFVPYIQLHEFEGLLFAAIDGFDYLTDVSENNLRILREAVFEKENPELLNDGELTAPSKRLERLIPGFDRNKPFYGGIITDVNTIEPVLERCVRFRAWVELLISKMKA